MSREIPRLIKGLAGAAADARSGLGRGLIMPFSTPAGNLRDSYPLPLASELEVRELQSPLSKTPGDLFAAVVDLVNLAVLSLNALNSGRKSTPPPMHPSNALQRASLQHIIDGCTGMAKRLNSLDSAFTHGELVDKFASAGQPPRPSLVASKIDIPAATCDPSIHFGAALREKLAQMGRIFPYKPIGAHRVRIGKRDMAEYLCYTQLAHRAGKLEFCICSFGDASMSIVGKSGKDRLRPIWSGDEISEACIRPPKPRRLGYPSAFVDILVQQDESRLFEARRGDLL